SSHVAIRIVEDERMVMQIGLQCPAFAQQALRFFSKRTRERRATSVLCYQVEVSDHACLPFAGEDVGAELLRMHGQVHDIQEFPEGDVLQAGRRRDPATLSGE